MTITGDVNESFITMFNVKSSGFDKNESPKTESIMEENLCYVYDGITMQYYSFWVFKLQSDTRCRLILLTTTRWTWKSEKKKKKKKDPAQVNKKDVLKPNLGIITLEKMLDLDWFTISSLSPRLCAKWFPSIVFSTKCSE